MPGIQRKSEAVYQVNKLVIPGERAPRALRRVLRVFLNSIKFPQDELSETIKEIEESVLSQNEAWWKTLKEKSACLPENHTIHDLCNTALSHLEGYRSRMAGLE